jgi:hypothetical protein
MLSIENLDDMSQRVEIFSTLLKSPTVLISDRTFIDAKYIYPEFNIAMMSSQGLESFAEVYETISGQKDVTYGNDLLTAFKFEPFIDENGVPQGTRTTFVSWSDFGGSVPKSLVSKLAPKELCVFYDEIVTSAK